MAIQLLGSVSGVAADVNANKEVLVSLSKNASDAIPTYLVGKAHPDSPVNTGSITGSTQGLLGVGNVFLEMEENFVSSTINTSKWKLQTATMTGALNSNIVTLNSGASLAAAAYAILGTYRTFKLYRGADRIIAWRISLNFAPITNNVVEFGGGIVGTTADPIAGAFFRYDANGSLKGVVITNSGTEVTTTDLISVVTGSTTVFHDYLVVIGQNNIIFEIDGQPVANIPMATNAAAPAACESFPAFVRTYNILLTTQAQKVNIARLVSATLGGETNMPKTILAALAGDVSYQSVVGVGTGVSTSNNTNGTAPGTAVLSATTPAATTLDGSLLIAGYTASEVDNIIFGFQVPAGTLTNMGRTLLIHGVRISFVIDNGSAISAAAIWVWQLGFGATAASLNTTETANAKAYRKLHLGITSFLAGAPTATQGLPIHIDFEQPIAVNAGEFLSLIVRQPAGSATGTPVYRLCYTVNGTWE